MKDNVRLEVEQHFNDNDYVLIKNTLKKEKENNGNRKQYPSAFFTIFAIMAFVSYINKDLLSMFFLILGCIISVIAIYYVNYYDEKGIALYRFIFARCIFTNLIFMNDVIECVDQKQEINVISYAQVHKVFELKSLIILKSSHEQIPYIFILKRSLANVTQTYLQTRLQEKWKCCDEKTFHLN